MVRKVELVPHDLEWRSRYESEARSISGAIASNLAAIHHIGSTSIPGIDAKPIIDILVEVNNLALVDANSLDALGYEGKGEAGVPGRRFFLKDDASGIRTYHVHVYEVGSFHIDRHLNFRDYLIAHPQVAQQYNDLKRNLAKQFFEDVEQYTVAKTPFIRAIEAQAAQWRTS